MQTDTAAASEAMELTAELKEALNRMPNAETHDWASYRSIRQGGLTNRVFRILHTDASESLSDSQFIVRLAGEGTAEYIDREVEAWNAVQAHIAGVSAEVLLTEPATGLMISRYIPDVVTMSADYFATRHGAAARAGDALKKLHISGVEFRFRFELFSMIDEYLKVLSSKTVDLPAGYGEVVEQAQPVKAALARRDVPLAPCHCDPLCENFLDDGQTMWIVDWEYSGMNDPYWDLGDLSVEGNFSAELDAQMMRAYCNGEPQPWQSARMLIYKAMCDLLWTLWGLIQHADGNPAEDFWAYATGRFDRCRQLMQSDRFGWALDNC